MKAAVNCLLVFLSFSAFGAVFGNADNRMSYPEYASHKFPNNPQALSAYSAAGRITCPRFWASGTLVLHNDILVFAGHSAMEKDKKGRCVHRSDLGSCVFQSIRYDGSLGQPVKIDPASVKVSRNFRCEDVEFDNDWAVARLRSPYSDVNPFDLWDTDSPSLPMGALVTIFSAQNESSQQPTVCEGLLGYVWKMNSGSNPGVSYGLGTNCSAGEGNSGGAVTIIGGKFVRFVGLISLTQGKKCDGLPFDSSCFTGGPYIKSELQTAITGE